MIRRATIADAASIARIHVNTWRVAYADLLPAAYLARLSEENRTTSWQKQLADGKTIVFVATEGDQTVGWAAGGLSRDAAARSTGEVYALYVAPENWRRGIGRQLLHALEAELPTSSSVTLWVLSENTRARGFYHRLGYLHDGATQEIEIGGMILTEVRLRKAADLRATPPVE